MDEGLRQGAASLPPLQLGKLFQDALGLDLDPAGQAVHVRAEGAHAMSLAARLGPDDKQR